MVRSLERSESGSKRVTASQQNCDSKERGAKTPTRHQMTNGEGHGERRQESDRKSHRKRKRQKRSEKARRRRVRKGGRGASERARSQAAMAMAMAGVKEQEGAFRVLLETLSSSASR